MAYKKSPLPGASHAKNALRDHLNLDLEPGSQEFVLAMEDQPLMNANVPDADLPDVAQLEHAPNDRPTDVADSHSDTPSHTHSDSSSQNSHAAWDHAPESDNAHAQNHATGLDAGTVASTASSHELRGLDLAHALMETIHPAGSPSLGMPPNAGPEGFDRAAEHAPPTFDLPSAAQNILASLTEHPLTLPQLPSLPQASLDAPSAALPDAALSFVPVDLVGGHHNGPIDHLPSALIA